jgi:DNA-binding transcriptional LysR family regulator
LHFDELRAFVAVVDRGSISAASKALRFPIATLRRRLDELEIRLGVKLLDRSPDGAIPTTAGFALVERARVLLSDVNTLREAARSAAVDPPEEVVVGVPPSLPPEIFSLFFKLMQELVPGVTWTFRIVEDLRAAGAMHLTALLHLGDEVPDASWVAHELFSVKERLIASREYVARRGTPSTLDDLANHTILLWDGPTKRGDALPLLGGGQVAIRPAMRSAEVWLLRQCAARGSGIAYLPAERPPKDAFSSPEDFVTVLGDTVGSRNKGSILIRRSAIESRLFPISLEQMRRLVAALVW